MHGFNTGRNIIVSREEKLQPMFFVKSGLENEILTTHKNKVDSAKLPQFFHWWLKISYYGLCIPFKSTFELNSGSYELQSDKLQKVRKGESMYHNNF